MAKTETLHIRVTPEARELIERAAQKAKRTLSDYGAIGLEEMARRELGEKTAAPAGGAK